MYMFGDHCKTRHSTIAFILAYRHTSTYSHMALFCSSLVGFYLPSYCVNMTHFSKCHLIYMKIKELKCMFSLYLSYRVSIFLIKEMKVYTSLCCLTCKCVPKMKIGQMHIKLLPYDPVLSVCMMLLK